MGDWQKVVRAELDSVDGFSMRTDAPVPVIDLRHKVLGLRTAIANFFTAEKVGGIAMRAGVNIARYATEQTARVVGIPLTDALPRAALEAFRGDNIAKVRGLAAWQLDELDGVLSKAQATGLRVEDLASDIQDRFDVTESYATLLARDQTLSFNGQITKQRQEEIGVKRYVWVTSRDERVRPSHRDLNGKEMSWSDPPVVDEKTGRRAHPGQDYQCRCTASPVLDDVFSQYE